MEFLALECKTPIDFPLEPSLFVQPFPPSSHVGVDEGHVGPRSTSPLRRSESVVVRGNPGAPGHRILPARQIIDQHRTDHGDAHDPTSRNGHLPETSTR